MKLKFANIISIIGHPLLTIPVFVVVAVFKYEELRKASLISALILGGVFIPLTIKMYKGHRNGAYTNFDVSNKLQRQPLYLFVLTLLFAVTIILFVTDQSRMLRLNVLFSFILLLLSKILNYSIKSSLHVSLNTFLAFLIMQLNITYGLVFLSFVPLISWSRLILKRHTVKELIYGGLIGFLIGALTFTTTTGYLSNLITK